MDAKKKEVPIWEKMTITVEEAIAYSGIGRHKLDELVRDPRCSFVLWVGKKRLIKREKFEKFIENRLEI